MKANIETVLVGEKVVLVPYRPEHVSKYHSWMLSEELRTLTASEPLSLEEEYEMQQKWQVDEDKLTFIILAHKFTDFSVNKNASQRNLKPMDAYSPIDPRVTSLPMAGDVNLFLKGVLPTLRDSNSVGAISGTSEEGDIFEAEVEIMIAEPEYRRKGLALEALRLMLTYATGNSSAFCVAQEEPSGISETLISPLKIPPTSLLTRITETNQPSIRLFEKLGFKVTKRVEIFGEVEMRWSQ